MSFESNYLETLDKVQIGREFWIQNDDGSWRRLRSNESIWPGNLIKIRLSVRSNFDKLQFHPFQVRIVVSENFKDMVTLYEVYPNGNPVKRFHWDIAHLSPTDLKAKDFYLTTEIEIKPHWGAVVFGKYGVPWFSQIGLWGTLTHGKTKTKSKTTKRKTTNNKVKIKSTLSKTVKKKPKTKSRK